RRAVAALRGVQVGKGRLERVRARGGGEPLHGRDLAPVALEAEEQAGEDRLAVDDDGAGPALAEFTAVLRAREPHVLAQDLEERLVGLERDLLRLAVDA